MSFNYTDQKKLTIKEQARKRQRRRILITLTVVAVIAVVVVVGGYFLATYRQFGDYSVRSTIELKGSADNLSYHAYSGGFLQCSSNGLTYFTRDEIIWDEEFEMSHPLIDVCRDYIAVADMKQSDVYIYDRSGLVGRISTQHDILDVEIASDGTVALSTNDGDSNFIELKDVQGNERINAKFNFSSSGYLQDITLSDDGQRLAAAFIYVSQGALESKVLFYDFSKNDTDDMLVGGFSQYSGTVLTTVEFMKGDVVCAMGDNAMTFYRFSGTPQIISEQLDLDWEVQSVNMDNEHILCITKDDNGEFNYRAHVFNTSGEQIADVGFDFAYNRAVLAGSNIVLYSQADCQMYSFKGIRRFSGSFGERISGILPSGSTGNLLLATVGSVRLIRLK